MIDLHCHILYGVDDGAQTEQEAVDMARAAVASGITHILCTPHHNNGKYNNAKHTVISRVAKFQRLLDDQKIPLILYEGQEVRITGELLTEIKQDNILFVDIKNKYLLIEFPTIDVPKYTAQIFSSLLTQGITPVIVHPERNAIFQSNPKYLTHFLDMGALSQLTAPSYTGFFGKKVQKISQLMVKHNLVHMVASDAHGVTKRPFFLKEAYEKIEQDFGSEKVQKFKQTAKDMVNGDICKVLPYTEPYKTIFGNFK
ncbi:tyrosine-protein phosphatase [Vagococcus entomophilus]|uniref:Tyrosine-protein phosphatase n=1 Tax=Vagococcus entomophilus TaxID=1160095 RepID=A0A430AIP2_9ENTE|nr:CpsB/CapC family capsule biosynthesis tyrosine phosphatase [Vagococcus entomophilus]RSU07854.1 tyrosine protein phosphatase [Vagococcus entomophilus]